MPTEDQISRVRDYFIKEPFVDRTGVNMPDAQSRIANALEYIAYQLWVINGKMKRQ